jgi:hypothetical protein
LLPKKIDMNTAIQTTQTTTQRISKRIRTGPPVGLPEEMAVVNPRSSRRLRTPITLR